MRFRPYSIRYTTQDELTVHLYGRNEDGSRGYYQLKGTEPGFWSKDIPRHQKVRRVDRGQAETLEGDPLNRVVTRFPFEVPDVRRKCSKTWEADVFFANRVRYDHQIRNFIEVPRKKVLTPEELTPIPWRESPEPNPRIATFDIEVMDKTGFSEPTNPKGEVISIALHDNYKDKYVALFNGELYNKDREVATGFFKENGLNVQTIELPSEQDLFGAFRDYCHQVKPDILAGWNSGDVNHPKAFDVPYLHNRADRCGYTEPDWRQFSCFDLGRAYRRWHRSDNPPWSLDHVSQTVGFEGKNLDQRVWEAYEKEPGKLIAYNVNDVLLTKGIGDRLNLFKFFVMLSGFAGCSLEDSTTTGRVVDSYIFHWLSRNGINKKRPTKRDSNKEEVKGGYVAAPIPDVHRFAVEIDLASQYPNAMRTFNMSPETRVGDDYDGETADLGFASYRLDERGLFPRMLDEILELRYELKAAGEDVEQRVVKEVANTYYGQLSSPRFRDYDPLIGNDITGVSREILQMAEDVVREHGCKPIYGDTDSVYFIIEGMDPSYEETVEYAERIVGVVNEKIHEMAHEKGCHEVHLEIELEHVYDRAWIVPAKKTYACIYRDPDGDIEHDGFRYSMKIRGFGIRRSDSASITQEVQHEVFKRILLGEDRDSIVEYLREVVQETKDGRREPEEFFKPIGINQSLSSYKSNSQHVRAAKWSNRHLGKNLGEGDKILVVHGHVEGKPKTDVFGLEYGEDIPKDGVVDWETALTKTVMMPLSRVFDEFDIKRREILAPSSTMGEWF